MIDTIYIEKQLKEHPAVEKARAMFPSARHIECARYGEVFNTRAQHFRHQKRNPSLIIAEKHGKTLHPIPEGYGIGAPRNFYFSHFLNCPYDCSYCFLQGMYRSAHFVWFVNYDAFIDEIKAHYSETKTTFFSGYDGDSLAMDSLTGFVKTFIPLFDHLPSAELEIRTKSAYCKPLLELEARAHVIPAYTLSPEPIAKAFEKGAPPLRARLKAIEKLQRAGWPIGLRFDPTLFVENYETLYAEFFQTVFSLVRNPHSVTLGGFRMPISTYKNMRRILPDSPLLAACRKTPSGKEVALGEEMLSFCKEHILRYVEPSRLFVYGEVA